MNVNGKDTSEIREEHKCTSDFKMEFDSSVNLTLKLQRTNAGLQHLEFLGEMLHKTLEMEFSNFSCLLVRFGNICVCVPSKGQGTNPTLVL